MSRWWRRQHQKWQRNVVTEEHQICCVICSPPLCIPPYVSADSQASHKIDTDEMNLPVEIYI